MAMIFDVRVYGAAGDGITIDTKAVQNAIDDCARAGGGIVLLERGVFLSGTLFLKSNVELRVEASAVLKASPDIRDYSADTHHNRYRNEEALDRCFLYAEDQQNIRLTGGGEINGSGEAFPNEGSIYRPMLLRFLRCCSIRVEDLKLYDAAAWTTAFLDSSGIWISRVDICNEKRYNGDGLDFDGCSHVFVEGCSITGTDDNLCLQSSSRDYPVEDIHISGCSFTSLCAGIRIGLKSIGDIRNVSVSGCTMNRVWREGIKIECTEGGNISGIVIQNIAMRDVSRPLFMILNNRFRPDDYGTSVELEGIPDIGTMGSILIDNVSAIDSEEMKKTHYRFGNDIMGEPRFNGIRIDAEKRHPMGPVSISNFIYHTAGGVKKEDIPAHYPEVLDQRFHDGEETSENYYPDWSRAAFLDVRNVRGLTLSNVRFSSAEPDQREDYFIEGCTVYRKEIFVEDNSAIKNSPETEVPGRAQKYRDRTGIGEKDE